jgi:hypothetical protein
LIHWDSLNSYFDEAAKEEKLPLAKTISSALRNPIYKLYLEFLAYNLIVI